MQEPWQTRWNDYYKVLGLKETASADDVRRAFRSLARRWHPDIVAQEPTEVRQDAERQFRLIAEANEVLSDPERRRAYDAVWRDGGPPEPSTLHVEPPVRRVRTYRGIFTLSSRVDMKGLLGTRPSEIEVVCEDHSLELRRVEIDHDQLYQPYPLTATVQARYSGTSSRAFELHYYSHDLHALQRLEIAMPIGWLAPALLFLVPDSRGANSWWRLPEFSAKLGIAWQAFVAVLFPVVGSETWSALWGSGHAFFVVAFLSQIALSFLLEGRPPLGMRGVRWIAWAAIGAGLYAINVGLDSI